MFNFLRTRMLVQGFLFFSFSNSQSSVLIMQMCFHFQVELILSVSKKGERKIRGVGDKLVKRPSSSMSFRVSATSSEKKDIRIGLLGASGYTGAEVYFNAPLLLVSSFGILLLIFDIYISR